jgi:cell division protein ZapE
MAAQVAEVVQRGTGLRRGELDQRRVVHRRRRGRQAAVPVVLPLDADDATLVELAAAQPGAALDDFADLCGHLASLHPVRYGDLLAGVTGVFWRGVAPVADQSTALRVVVLADRLYDSEVPVTASGTPFDELFPAELLSGGYRKKYLRAVSRLIALSREREAGCPTRRS